MTRFLDTAGMLAKREFVRFLRQRSRIMAAVGTPALFWVFMGAGLNRSFMSPLAMNHAEGAASLSYLQYFFPGTVVLIVLFTAIFSTISVIEDRQEGFLQSVLVSPAPRAAIVLGKILGGAAIATFQGCLFFVLAPFLKMPLGFGDAIVLVLMTGLLSFALTGLGFFFAWILNSTGAFHGVMNLVLMPLWLLSGALFPVESASGWLRPLMMANPLTYGVAVLQRCFFHGPQTGLSGNLPFAFLVIGGFSIATFSLSLWALQKSAD